MNGYKKFKKRIYELFGTTKKGDILSIIIDIFFAILIISSCLCVILELFVTDPSIVNLLVKFEYITIAIFIFEYLVKLWVCEFEYPECKNKREAIKEYITSLDSIIDLVSIISILFNQIPKEYGMIKMLKLIKLVRIFKIGEHNENDGNDNHKEHQLTKYEKIKIRIHDIITKDTSGDKLSKIYDIFSVTLIFLSVGFIVTDTFTFNDMVHNILIYSEIVIACFFLLEYIVRIWLAPYEYPNLRPDKARVKYIFSFMAIIDILSILPIFVVNLPSTTGVLKIFKLCKVLRLVKSSRYLSGVATFGIAIKNKAKQIIFSIVALVILVVICSLIMYSLEHKENGEVFENGFSGITILLSSITTIVQAEGAPITSAGQMLLSIMTLLGGCIFGVPVAIIASGFSDMISKQAGEDEEKVTKVFEQYEELNDEEKEEFLEKIKK